MSRVLDILEAAALLALTLFLIKSTLLIKSTQQAIDGFKAQIGSAQPAIESTNQAMKELAEASKRINQAATSETAFLATESTQLEKVTRDVKAILVHTDHSLNDPYAGVLPAAQKTLVGFTDIEKQTAHELDALDPAISDFLNGAHQFSLVLSSPVIMDTLHHVDHTANSISLAADDLHTETTLIVGATRQATRPQNKLLTILKAASGGTLTGVELWYYLTK